MHRRIHFERTVIVTASVLGTDNQGYDWPHPNAVPPPGKKATDINPDYPIDDGMLLNQLPIWAPDAAIRQKILVANPARLYDFR